MREIEAAPDARLQAQPDEQSLRTIQSVIWAVVFMCTWLAVAQLLPGPSYELADDLRERGSTVETLAVRRHIDTGRGLYVADVEVTYLAGGRSVTTRLQHVGDADSVDEAIIPRDGPDWGSGPFEWWEEASEIPQGSRYAPPLELRYLPEDPERAMAQVDLDAIAAEGRSNPAAAFFLVPLAIALLVPPVRRVAFRRSSTV